MGVTRMICPYCRTDIDDDSRFCEQCGKEILICSECGRPGKGKKCIHDGRTLIRASARAGVSADGVPPEAGITSSHATEVHLINRHLDLDLKIAGDEVIGRQIGGFADIFEQHKRVSGRHCQIRFEEKRGWVVVDLGSTHGTRLNNVPLLPMQAEPLTDESLLLIANIEFYVEMRSKNAGAADRSS